MKSRGLLCLLLVTAWLAAAAQCQAQTQPGLQFRDVQVAPGKYRYEVFVPPRWTAEKKWPVILFLHGAGHRGSYVGPRDFVLGKLFLSYQHPSEFVIVFPRCPEGRWWSEPEMAQMALAALEQTVKEFRGDSQRIYLTGMSMGGYGTWYLAAHNPGKFAAIAPVCAGLKTPGTLPIPPVSEARDPYADTARRIGRTPVWMFHGSSDATIPVEESRRMAAALRVSGGNVRYTEYEGVGHNAWDRAYAELEFFRWLRTHRLPARTPAAPR